MKKGRENMLVGSRDSTGIPSSIVDVVRASDPPPRTPQRLLANKYCILNA